jgi:glycerate dehydrogenase
MLILTVANTTALRTTTMRARAWTSLTRTIPLTMTRRCQFSSTSTSSSSSSTTTIKRPKAVFLNASRLDYDGKLDWSRLESICETLVLHPVDKLSDPQDILELVRSTQADIVITKEMPLAASVFTEFPDSVQLLCEAGTGFNNLPVQAARARGVPVCNIPTYSTEAVAHMAITYIMNFSCSMFQQQSMLLQDDRSNFTGPFTLPLHELNDKTLGLIGGAGRIGTKVAEIGVALGMKVIISSRAGSLGSDHVLCNHPAVTCTSDVNYVLQQSDYVSLHTPLNDATRGTFGRAQIEQMKPTAFLINTSRGAVCNEEELIDCLRERVIAGAGLDVTTTEPPTADSPLWDKQDLPNVWLSPHTGWRRLETRQRLLDMTADNVAAFWKAQSPDDYINVVN